MCVFLIYPTFVGSERNRVIVYPYVACTLHATSRGAQAKRRTALESAL